MLLALPVISGEAGGEDGVAEQGEDVVVAGAEAVGGDAGAFPVDAGADPRAKTLHSVVEGERIEGARSLRQQLGDGAGGTLLAGGIRERAAADMDDDVDEGCSVPLQDVDLETVCQRVHRWHRQGERLHGTKRWWMAAIGGEGRRRRQHRDRNSKEADDLHCASFVVVFVVVVFVFGVVAVVGWTRFTTARSSRPRGTTLSTSRPGSKVRSTAPMTSSIVACV